VSPAAAIDHSSLAAVQERVAQVQQRITSLSGQVTSVRSGASTQASSTAFAQALTQASGALPPSPAGGAATGSGVVASAMKHLGVPYLWGGTDPAKGLDCSALVQLAMRENGIDVPRVAAAQAKVGTEVPSLDQARPGDLVVLRGGAHIGIYVGDGKMVHAPKTGDVVRVADVYEKPVTIRRLTGESSTGALTGAPAGPSSPAALGGAYLRPAALRGDAATGAAAYQELFDAATARHGLPAGLLSAVAKVESGYDPTAVSPAGARGLMQIMPGTARDLGVDPMVPSQAVDGAARLLSQHLESFGSLPLALAAYNAGPGNVRKHGGIPPFAETEAYVRKVTDARGRTA
jgi:cell wall-associated NlpC family hydrolase